MMAFEFNESEDELGLAGCFGLRFSTTMPDRKSASKSIKSAAARLVKDLPESASWDDLMYEIFVRQKVEAGLADLEAGRQHDHASIVSEFVRPG
jgi:hypothetical protein